MRLRSRAFSAALCLATSLGAVAASCGNGEETANPPSTSGGGSGGSGGDASSEGGGGYFDGGLLDGIAPDAGAVTIEPSSSTLTVETGKPVPTVTFVAKVNGNAVPALWLVDRGELGAIGLHDGVFTPAGILGGQATINATIGSTQATATVRVVIKTVQNGASSADGGTGSAGWGGVGGEGPGVAVDPAMFGVLQSIPQADPSLKWLYPYDKTVWPLGILAPLLQWAPGSAAVDAVSIHLSSPYYDYVGTFGRPAALPDSVPFEHHPIPQDAWKAATQSSAGGDLTVSLVVASGGTAYGPINETWKVASGPLKGTVYYQSYGTHLAKNLSGGMGGDGLFGGATLAIRGNSSEPSLVAGSNGGHEACRVCHTVSSNGTRMVVQHGENYAISSSYDLNNGYAETSYGPQNLGKFGWVGLSPDGKLGLNNAAPLHAQELGTTALFDMDTAAELPSTGLQDFVTKAGFPAFSPDGKHIAFNFYQGPGDGTSGAGDASQLVVMDFDATNYAFSNPRVLHKGPVDQCPGWPSFLPSNDAVVFSMQSRSNTKNEWMTTRYGGRGELWWTDLATGTAFPLDRANGKENGVSYLPVGANGHDDDTTLHYEPTTNPVVSGGYAWIVFMSRRMYGNVATIDPWWSDPREHDLTVNVTTKKLWVAAVDLNPQPGTDASHPAFYLPAQELMAGNTRGFWVVDPCKNDGSSCESGDQCCGGYCQMDGDAGALICSNHTNECANEYDKCTVAADCCDFLKGGTCVNGRCAAPQGPH